MAKRDAGNCHRLSALAAFMLAWAVPLGAQSIDPARVLPAAALGQAQIDIHVAMPQDGLMLGYGPVAHVRTAGNDGILGNLISRALQKDASKRAKSNAIPFAEVLGDFDLDGLAIDATRSALAGHGKFRLGSDKPAMDPAALLKSGRPTAILAFEYGVHPEFNRVYAGCTFQLPGSGAKNPWLRDNLSFAVTNQASVDIAGLPQSKRERILALSKGQGTLLRRLLKDTFETCARLALRRVAMSKSELDAIRGQDKVTVTTLTNVQYIGWAVEGGQNLQSASFGALKIRKNMVRQGSEGITILEASGGLMQFRTDQAE